MKKSEFFSTLAFLFSLVLLLGTTSGYAAEYSPAQLTKLTEKWAHQELHTAQATNIQLQVIPLDNRIGIKHCSQPLQFSLPQGSSQRQNTVLILCPDESQWQLYAQLRITEMITALIVKQNIAAGNQLTASMLHTEERDRRFVRGNVATDIQQIIGAKSRRAMSAGQIVTMQDLCLVCKGDVVTISVDNAGLNVSVTGIAQTDGTLGDTITVLNRQSNRTIIAEVIAVNQVQVKF